MEIHFRYIENNLERILNNPDDIMFIEPSRVGKKIALFAIIKEDDGVYKKLQITKEQSKFTFPFEPIYWFYNGPGYTILKNFISIHNWQALNPVHLEGFLDNKVENAKFFDTCVYATFNDGSATLVERKNSKALKKHGGIQSYMDLLGDNKNRELKYDSYSIIENYDVVDDTIVIPELKNKAKENQKIKKLSTGNK